jgi:hypothetical protein
MRYTRLVTIAILFTISAGFTHSVAELISRTSASAMLLGSHTIVLSDTAGVHTQLIFGVNSRATNCIDYFLGESEQPPAPPSGVMYATFINNENDAASCLGNGLINNYHRYDNPAQIDTFTFKFQPGPAGYPLTFSWDSLAGSYSGPVTLQDAITGTLVNVDMKSTSTATVTNKGITQLMIVASGPIYTPPVLPIVITDSTANITPTSAVVFGSTFTDDPDSTWIYFQYAKDTLPYDLYTTTGTWIYNDSLPHAFNAELTDLAPYTLYYYRAVASHPNGTVYGEFRQFQTSISNLTVTTNMATDITDSSATLSGTVYRRDTSITAFAFFYWGQHTDPSLLPEHRNRTDTIIIAGPTNPVTFTTTIHGLKPGTTYFFYAVAHDGIGSRIGNELTFSTTGNTDTLQFAIPLRLTSGSLSTEATFGLNPAATYCIDRNLGEMEWPPIPPTGNLDFRFIDSRTDSGACLGQGVKLNLHLYYSATQVDTFLLAFQSNGAGIPVTLHWHNMSKYYNGTVALTDLFDGVVVNVDMKTQDSITITNSAINRLLIIAAEPAFVPSIPPLAVTEYASNIAATSAEIHGTAYSNGLPSIAFFEWGPMGYIGYTTPMVSLDTIDPHALSATLTALTPGTEYGYRLVVQNANGTSRGVLYGFNTLQSDSSLRYIKIPLTYGNNMGVQQAIWFGVHPQATFCIDSLLGETPLPPPPPLGYLDVRFIDPNPDSSSCFDQGLGFDLRPFFNTAQTDTYRVKIQPDSGQNSIAFSWPDLNQYYYGPVVLYYRVINEMPVIIDMKNQRSAIIPTGMLFSFTITANGPRLGAPPSNSDVMGYWKFDDESTILVHDSSPNQNDGTAHGTMLISGKSGTARHFFPGDFVQIPNSRSLNFDSSESFAISFWFRSTDSSFYSPLIQKGGSIGYCIRLHNGHIEAVLSDGIYDGIKYNRTGDLLVSDSLYTDGEWHYVVFAKIAPTKMLYLSVDDRLAAQPTYDILTGSLENDYPLLIGRSIAQSSILGSYTGDLDEIKLIRGEISTDWEGGMLPTVPGAPVILSVTDVPNDQGKQVLVRFASSSFQGDTVQPITHYSIWRNDGAWTFLGDIPARNDSVYGFVAPTLYDSTISGGMHWTWFQVTAHTANPTIFYTSGSLEGFSIDNLAPQVPEGLTITATSDGALLRWNSPVDNDFQYFIVYRSDSRRMPAIPVFDRLTTTTANEFTDHTDPSLSYFSYRIAAVDFSGNESNLSVVINSILGVNNGSQLPQVFALHQNYPNPFNPTTTITYDLPSSAFVTVKVYNIIGEEITTLVNGDLNAGIHTVSWNAGSLPSGVYHYRIMATPKDDAGKPFIQSLRMVLVK